MRQTWNAFPSRISARHASTARSWSARDTRPTADDTPAGRPVAASATAACDGTPVTVSSHTRFRALAAGSVSATSVSAQAPPVWSRTTARSTNRRSASAWPSAVRSGPSDSRPSSYPRNPTQPSAKPQPTIGSGRGGVRSSSSASTAKAGRSSVDDGPNHPAAGAATSTDACRSWCRNRARNGPSVHARTDHRARARAVSGAPSGNAESSHTRSPPACVASTPRSGAGSSRRTSMRTPADGPVRSRRSSMRRRGTHPGRAPRDHGRPRR